MWQIVDTDTKFHHLYWSLLYLLEIKRHYCKSIIDLRRIQETESYRTVDYDFKRMKELPQDKTDAKLMQRASREELMG